MLTDNDVVEVVTQYLLGKGYTVVRGSEEITGEVDIIARDPKSGARLLLNVAGVARSKAGRGRLEGPYTETQVFRSVARAVHGALLMHGTDQFKPGDRIALAFPDTPAFCKYLAAEKPVLDSLGVKLFLVAADKTVSTL